MTSLDVSYELVHRGRPWTLNTERARHWTTRDADTEEFRKAFNILARQLKIPKLDRVTIDAFPQMTGTLQDTGNCYPAVKAAIDGLVDAHIIRDDTGLYVETISLHAPIRGPDQLRLQIRACP